MFHYKSIKLETKDVYEPAEDSILLAEAVESMKNKNILEIGCGSGFISILLAKNNKVTSIDINKKAVEITKKNAELNSVKLECFQSDLFENIKEKYDIIVFNAPYLPDNDNIENSEIWSDKDTVSRFVKQFNKFLNSQGKVLIVISSLTGLDRVISMFKNQGFKTKIIKEQKIPWETLYVLVAEK